MPDKKALAEAVALIRRQKRIMKKSLAGVGRVFDYDNKPQKAITSVEGMTTSPAPKTTKEKTFRTKRSKTML
jgi:hypothetical protein